MENFTEKFNNSFLFESPEKILVGKSMFQNILFDIGELIQSDFLPEQINNNLARIVLTNVAYYWHNDGTMYEGNVDLYLKTIQVAVSFNKTGYNYTVSQVGKRENTLFTPAELYIDILESERIQNIRLSSDKVMSAGGFNIWKEILRKHKLSYYDSQNPTTLTLIKDAEHLKSLFGSSSDNPEKDYFKRFQYVLSESNLDYLNCKSLFSLRETRRLAGYPESSL
jgi:hypothetical protein